MENKEYYLKEIPLMHFRIELYFTSEDKQSWKLGQKLCHQFRIPYYIATKERRVWTTTKGYILKIVKETMKMSIHKMKKNNSHIQLYNPYRKVKYKGNVYLRKIMFVRKVKNTNGATIKIK